MRTGSGVRQHTLLNLGTNFPYPREKWSEMAGRIEDIIQRNNAETGEIELYCHAIAREKKEKAILPTAS